MRHKIELFRANCKLCDYAEEELKEVVCGKCEIIIYKPEDCVDGSCCVKAENYGVKAVPSIVIDGKLALTGKSNSQKIKDILKLNSRR